MKIPSILLFLTLYTGALAAQEGGCGRAGALRCDADGRHVSACTRGGAWRPVLDCAASNAACVDGRCVASSSTRAKTCSTPGQTSCSSDCAYRTVCTLNNVWVEVFPCPAGYICDCGECVDKSTNYCRHTKAPICGKGSAGHFFPDVENCSNVYSCTQVGEPAFGAHMCRNDPNIYYQECTGSCVATPGFCNLYKSCNGNDGLDAVFPGNPTLHYICANGTMFLLKCENPTSVYDPGSGECIDMGVTYCPKFGMDVNNFSNIFTFEECVSTGSSTSTTDGSTSSTDGSTSTTDGSTTVPVPCDVGTKWPDDTNECMYYYCYPPGEPIHMMCPPNSKYSSSDKSCVFSLGSCLR